MLWWEGGGEDREGENMYIVWLHHNDDSTHHNDGKYEIPHPLMTECFIGMHLECVVPTFQWCQGCEAFDSPGTGQPATEKIIFTTVQHTYVHTYVHTHVHRKNSLPRVPLQWQ